MKPRCSHENVDKLLKAIENCNPTDFGSSSIYLKAEVMQTIQTVKDVLYFMTTQKYTSEIKIIGCKNKILIRKYYNGSPF